MVAKTSFGFEDLLVEELTQLGASSIKKATRAVHFEGDQELMYRVNLWSRVALRILRPIGAFSAASEQELYDGVRLTDWSQYMSPDDTLAVDAVASRSNLTHSMYIAQKTKDGIVDQFRNRMGNRPDVDTQRPKLRIHIHLAQNQATVSLDSSGESLHKRGYRQQTGDAPLNETLAAGMVLLSGWDQRSTLMDPMCGSATILIEAALMARNIPPGSFRTEFGFERWNDFDEDLWKKILDEAAEKKLPGLNFRIIGTDRSFESIKNATENIKRAGLQENIDLFAIPFEEFSSPEKPAVIMVNPPYGGRLSDEDLFGLYKQMGDVFKKQYQGCTAWVLTANKEAANKIGLHASRKIRLFNGALECRFLKFELYSGTKKMIQNPQSAN